VGVGGGGGGRWVGQLYNATVYLEGGGRATPTLVLSCNKLACCYACSPGQRGGIWRNWIWCHVRLGSHTYSRFFWFCRANACVASTCLLQNDPHLHVPSRYLYFLQSNGSALDMTVVAGPVSQFAGAFPSGGQAATDLDFMDEAALEGGTVDQTLRLFSGAWQAKKVFPLAIALGPCAAGKYASSALATCVSCPVGTFGSSAGLTSAACSGLCGAGSYGATAGQVSPSCSGPCSAGYACVAGSNSPTASQCPTGRYSLDGALACSMCPAGTYGSSPAATSPSCSGPCDPGRFGSFSGLTASTCSGACIAGYACPAGSTSGTTLQCSPGTYSLAGAGVCTPCPSGRYGSSAGLTSSSCTGLCSAGAFGSVPGLTNADCSGPCAAGYICPVGSISPTAVACAAGSYSLSGAGACTPCPAGVYGATPVMASALCSGPCAAGFFCPTGSKNATAAACPAGSYSTGGAGVCTPCPVPYSSTAASSVCVVLCPVGWSLWYDLGQVEGSHSCLKWISNQLLWDAANSSCTTLGAPQAHLLTATQVSAWPSQLCRHFLV
jgi:hypothetical protein